MTEAIEAVRIEIAKLECRPGDTIVIRLPADWGYEFTHSFFDYLERLNPFPNGVKVAMMPAGSEVTVARAA